MDKSIFNQPISNLSLPPIKSLDFKMNIHAAVLLMRKEKIGSVVITEKDKVIGILTERDILNKVAGIVEDYKKTLVTDIMTSAPTCMKLGDEISMAINMIEEGGFRHIPVINKEGTPISMVSIKDVLSYITKKLLR